MQPRGAAAADTPAEGGGTTPARRPERGAKAPAPCTVLILSRDIGGFYAGEIINGLMREVTAAGGRTLLVQAVEPDGADDGPGAAAAPLGVALAEAHAVVSIAPAATLPVLEQARAMGTPVVLVSGRVPGVDAPVVVPDNATGVRAGIEHLIAHRHTRIGFVADPSRDNFRERVTVYREVMAQHGLTAGEKLVFPASSYGETGGAAAARALLDLPEDERPTAVMTATDANALGLVEELARGGLSVPHDLAVIGFDDVEHAVFATPSLSTVHQRYDEVGALAGHLAVAAVRGEHVADTAHTASASVLVARASCGCRAGIVREGSVRTVPGGLVVERAELHTMLHVLLDRRDRGRLAPEDVSRIVARVDEVIDAQDDAAAADTVPATIDHLRTSVCNPETRRQIVGALTEYLQRLASVDTAEHGPPHARLGIARLLAGLWELQVHGAVQLGLKRERSVLEQGDTAAALLRADGDTARSLQWLSGTHVRAGVLGLWDGAPGSRLRISGVHDTTGSVRVATGETVDVTHFPPPGLVGAADASRGEVCLVVPVRSVRHEWGLLAVLAVIDTGWNREPYHHWASMLCQALEAEGLHAEVRANEERYANAARASNDGLWELELADGSGAMFLSARCRAMVGLSEGTANVTAWDERMHPEDRERVRGVFGAARDQPGTPVQVEYRVGDPTEGYRWVLSRGLAVAGADGQVLRIVGSLTDVHTRRELEEKLRQGALYDEITGLANRRLFLDRLATALGQTSRREDALFAVIFLDLDGFKLVNDSLGHLLGDELLRTVGSRLAEGLRAADTAARFGGDEFAVLLMDPDPTEVLAVARRIQARIAAPVLLDGHEVSVTASVGITTSASGYTDAEEVLRDADIAMYHAKAHEPGSASMFDRAMHTLAAGRLQARIDARSALAQNQFVVHYQPIVALDGSPVSRFEALVRWQHPERGLQPPADFLGAMEDGSTIVDLGRWVLDEVCRQVAAWRAASGLVATVAVNLSHREFWALDLRSAVVSALERHGVPPEALVLEVTEGVIMADADSARRTMTSLRETGVHLHIDDFGTGHSSLAALRTFPVDALKIDGSFVRELDVVMEATELVRVIIAMGAALGMEVVAECVETARQALSLQAMGCANAQGWLYARDLPGDTAGAVLGTRLPAASSLPAA